MHGLIRHTGLLFLPPGVGLMLHFGLIRREWLSIGAGPAVVALGVPLATAILAPLVLVALHRVGLP